MFASISTLGDSGWLLHAQNVLAGVAWIAAHVDMEKDSILVHCSDGWDRTSQLVSLANLLLDPYYRIFTGFQAFVEKDWLAFGLPFFIVRECHLSLEMATCLLSCLGSLQLAISHHHLCISHQENSHLNLPLHLIRITQTIVLPFFSFVVDRMCFTIVANLNVNEDQSQILGVYWPQQFTESQQIGINLRVKWVVPHHSQILTDKGPKVIYQLGHSGHPKSSQVESTWQIV
ncbi:hypothetical protein VNO77_07922 [Canavalia gladiata]|uniref:Myotubularin phosphatase domain-containing protein n=1 Tax=Canavalia gladiata TaxID=3824 RepID=A0AAN9QWD6_CANGL